MAHYVIGDLQGCFAEYQALLAKLGFNPGVDTLWLTGDLVNRGPKSLATLRFVRANDGCMQTVLGNHDLHLLALDFGHGKIKRGDTIAEILTAPDRGALLGWLREQPLLVQEPNHVMVHAGLWPEWTLETAVSLANEVTHALQHDPADFFAHMYGNKPKRWAPDLIGEDRLRFAVNVMTRMRALTLDGKLDFDFKSSLADMPNDLRPWFKSPDRRNTEITILFGHWSALGLYRGEHVVCLDTGALWGGPLTALDLNTQEIIQVPSQTTLSWEKIS